MTQIIQPNSDGKVILYDGSVVYIVQIQYSTDGSTYWESTYNDLEHYYENDSSIKLGPHQYIRFKHAGDTDWQKPAKFIGSDGIDGDNPIIAVNDGIIQWKLSEDSEWNDIVALEELIGPQGVMGQGWNIDKAGALDTRGSCNSSTSSCGCNPNSTSNVGLTTYMSLGNHLINENDYSGTQYHSFDGVTWTQTTIGDVGSYVNSWAATDNSGTGALTCNSQGYEVALASLVSPYISKGRVYVCSENLWTEVVNVTTPTGYVKVSTNDALQFLEEKLDNSTLESYDSGVGYNNKTRVKNSGITGAQLNISVAGAGLTGGGGDPLAVGKGAGITVDSNEVKANVDGSTVHINGADNLEVKDEGIGGVKIKTSVNPVFNPNKGFSVTNIDTTGAEVNPDGSSIGFNGIGQLEIPNNGVQGIHLNDDTCNTDKGVQVANDKLEAKIDSNKLEFTVGGEISVKDDYVTGLNPATSTYDLTDAGSGKVSITSGANSVLTNNVTIDINEANLDHVQSNGDVHSQYLLKSVVDVKGDILAATSDNTITRLPIGNNGQVLKADSSTTTGLKWVDESSPSSPGSVVSLDGNLSNGISGDFARADHKHSIDDNSLSISKTSGLQSALDSKLQKDTSYGNIRVTNNGLELQAPNGTFFKLTVDDNGNLGTTDI